MSATDGGIPTYTPDWVAASSQPVTITVSDTSDHDSGPFTPDLTREMWLTVVALGGQPASGTVTLMRDDGDGTPRIVTDKGEQVFTFSFSNASGTIINEITGRETSSGAKWSIHIKLTTGSVSAKLSQ